MCFAVRHHREPDGKQVWLASDGSLRCPHGEKSSTICYWLAEEKAARAKGEATPPRGGKRAQSGCDCQSTEGLNGTGGDWQVASAWRCRWMGGGAADGWVCVKLCMGGEPSELAAASVGAPNGTDRRRNASRSPPC